MARGTRLGRRLLLLHLLLLLLPIGGMLYLRSFERTLLEQEERAMVAEARWVAAALAPSEPGAPLTPAAAGALLRARERPLDARVRVVDAEGRLLADTVPISRRTRARNRDGSDTRAGRESWIYRAGASTWSFLNFLRGADRPRYRQEPPAALGSRLETPETASALAGRYGAATRVSPDGRFLVLSSAVPIRARGEVAGAVVVSRTTLGVLEALDRVRLDVFHVLLGCLAVALAASLLFSRFLVSPLLRLRDEAESLIDARGRIASRFTAVERKDEIGDLARSLAELSDRLATTVGELERFASDLAHELKNPLAAIRAAAELAAEVEEPAERQRLRSITEREVERAERLLSELQALAALEKDERGEAPGATELAPFVAKITDGWARRDPAVGVRVIGEVPNVRAALDEARLARIVENLLDNALSFSPPGTTVEIAARKLGDEIELDVADRGPGVPEEHRERIFDRFFSWRPDRADGGDEGEQEAESGRTHLGLGLDIARTIARRAGGDLVVEGRADGPGALFRLTLPKA